MNSIFRAAIKDGPFPMVNVRTSLGIELVLVIKDYPNGDFIGMTTDGMKKRYKKEDVVNAED